MWDDFVKAFIITSVVICGIPLLFAFICCLFD